MESLAVLRHRQFARFLGANTVANIGQFLQTLAVPFLMLRLTEDTANQNTWVGAAAFAALLPSVVTTPIAGILSDRINRRNILVSAFSLQSSVTLVFLVMHLGDDLTPWWVILLQLVSGVASGFTWPPVQAMAAVLVPPGELVWAVRLTAVSFTAGRAVGPALAGLILAFWGPGLAFAGTLTAYAIGITVLMTVNMNWTPTAGPRESFREQFRGGLAYVRERKPMRLVIMLSFFTAMLGAVWVFSLAASVAENGFHVGGGGLGALAAASGVGSAVASVWITGSGGDRVRRSRLEAIAVSIYMTGLFIVAATGLLVVGIVGFLVVGFAHMLHGTTMNTTLQVQVDEEFRGRVMSVWLTALLLGLPIGSIVGGFLADQFDLRAVMGGFAGTMGLIVATMAARTSRLQALDEEPLAASAGG